MDITRRSDYACRILRAAYEENGVCISVADVAERESIPYAFARSIQHDLVKRGLLRSVRGARGGLILDCDPEEVTLLDVLEAVQGPVSVAQCVADPEFCDKREECAYNKVWCGIDIMIQEYLAAITLDDLFKMRENHPAIKKAMELGQGQETAARTLAPIAQD